MRHPAVAGTFYPGDPEDLTGEVEKHVVRGTVKTPVVGVVCPHAGFMFSGDVAGEVYSRIEIPDTVLLIGPNHTGRGAPVSIMTEGAWAMPFGEVSIDSELALAICEASSLFRPDSQAHVSEHSLETQIPFLQYFRKGFRIVPLCLMRTDFKVCQEVSRAIVQGIRKVQRPVLMVASSDMTHYESHADASRKDHQAIEQILKRDPKGLFETVQKNGISMCGVNPVTVMLLCADPLGASRADLVKYMTSGEVSGDMDRVVGYAGMIVR